MAVNNKNNKFISYIIILVTFFVLILFTKGEILELQENIDSKDTSNIELNGKIEKLKKINETKTMLNKSSENIDKYEVTIKEDEIVDYIYSYIEETNKRNGVVLVKNITISEAKKTEIGFNETDINLSLIVSNEEKLKTILTYLTSHKSKYNFFIDSFNYPYGKGEGDITVIVPLKLLYK